MAGTNITLAVDEDLVERAREAARQQGTSLNALIREYIEELAGKRTGEEVFGALRELWKKGRGRSGGRKIDRDSLYEGRGGRTRIH